MSSQLLHLYNIEKLGNKTQIKSCTILVKSMVRGKLNYTLALLSNSTKQQLQKLNTLITKSCRIIIGNPCLRWTSNRLLNKCKLKTIWHMISEQDLTYRHKIQQTKTPPPYIKCTLYPLDQNAQTQIFALNTHPKQKY